MQYFALWISKEFLTFSIEYVFIILWPIVLHNRCVFNPFYLLLLLAMTVETKAVSIATPIALKINVFLFKLIYLSLLSNRSYFLSFIIGTFMCYDYLNIIVVIFKYSYE